MREGQGRRFLLILVTSLITFVSNAQEINVKGGFLEDSLLIGQNVRYWMVASYPPRLELSLPDSNATFGTFEFADKTYFPTKLKEGLAYDSAIYTLQSFEIDPVQYLSLNAMILNGGDSTIIKSNKDSIYLTELAPVVTDTTKLKTNLDYQAVNRQFNYPLMYYIVGGLILLTLILLLIFGKQIIRFFKLRKLARNYAVFSEAFTGYVRKMKETPSPELAEDALTLWRKYQQQLDKTPFTTLTTKEILSLEFAKELDKPLKSIDRVVYGKRIQENIYQDFQLIEDFTDERYRKKVEAIKHGE